MDQEAQDRFAWRMFLGLVQCIFVICAVHNFITPHHLLSTELCFAAFLITFFAMVMELNNHPTRRSFRVQASTEDAEGQWTVSLEQEHRNREIIEELGYGPCPLDHNGNWLLALSEQEWTAIEAEARLILDELAVQNGSLTTEQQTHLEQSIARRYRIRQQVALSMQEWVNKYYLWRQGLAAPILAPLPYRPSPIPRNPFMGQGGETSLMFTPFEGSALQLVPRANRTADDILQFLPSPSHSSGEFIGLTDASDRHYPIHFQVNHPSEAPLPTSTLLHNKMSSIFTPSVVKEESINTQQALQFLMEPMKNKERATSWLLKLFGETSTHSSGSEFLSSKSRSFPTLYTQMPSQVLGPAQLLPPLDHHISLMPSEAPSFRLLSPAQSESGDPSDLPIHLYGNNGLWNPEYLARRLCSVFTCMNNPQPNYIALACLPVKCMIVAPWYEHPLPTTMWPWESSEEFQPYIMGWTPTPEELFPLDMGDIFALFFLKEDIYYPWLRQLGYQTAWNTSQFRKAWLKDEVQYANGEKRCFCSLLFVQKRFAEFVDQISDHVVNAEARKVTILNQDAVASLLALGVNDLGDWLLSNNFWHYFTDACSPHYLPYAGNVTRTLRPRRAWYYFPSSQIRTVIHRAMNLASFEVLLLFCNTSKDWAKLAQYIPFVKLFPTQVLATTRKGLLWSDTRIESLIFPSCVLEYWSDDSGLAGFFFRSSKKIYNPHYFETLDFISAEELTWEKDPSPGKRKSLDACDGLQERL